MSFPNPNAYNNGGGDGGYGGGYQQGGYPQGGGYGGPPPPQAGGYGQQSQYPQGGGGYGGPPSGDSNYGGSPAPYGAGPQAHQQPSYGAGPPQSQGSAGEFYGGQQGGAAGGAGGQAQAYDENGNYIPEGERGLGTMAMGEFTSDQSGGEAQPPSIVIAARSPGHLTDDRPAPLCLTGGMAGFAANKMSGGGHGNMASIGTGALLAQGSKMAYEWFNERKGKQSHGGGSGGYGGPPGGGYGGPPGGGYGGPPGGGYGGPGGHHGGGGGGGGGFFGKRDI